MIINSKYIYKILLDFPYPNSTYGFIVLSAPWHKPKFTSYWFREIDCGKIAFKFGQGLSFYIWTCEKCHYDLRQNDMWCQNCKHEINKDKQKQLILKWEKVNKKLK